MKAGKVTSVEYSVTTLLCKLTNNYITDYKGGLSITDPLSVLMSGRAKIDTGHLMYYLVNTKPTASQSPRVS